MTVNRLKEYSAVSFRPGNGVSGRFAPSLVSGTSTRRAGNGPPPGSPRRAERTCVPDRLLRAVKQRAPAFRGGRGRAGAVGAAVARRDAAGVGKAAYVAGGDGRGRPVRGPGVAAAGDRRRRARGREAALADRRPAAAGA